MQLYGNFNNDSATVTISIFDSLTDAVVVDSQPMINIGGGSYKYSFVSIDYTKDYYFKCFNITDGSEAFSAIDNNQNAESLLNKVI